MTESTTEPQYDLTTSRVVVQAEWRGLVHKCEKAILPEAATHYQVDKAVWDAHVEVRRALVQQQYPNMQSVDSLTRAGVRNEVEAFGAIRNYLAVNPGRVFSLVPPNRYFDMWRAYFEAMPGHDIKPEPTPPVGVGMVDYIAVENLLRFVEGKEAIDG